MPTRPKKLRRRETDLPVKEAKLRENDRIIAAKNIILRNLALMLNKSNGMIIEPSSESMPIYRYMLGRGNNSHLIRDLFKSRPWWSAIDRTTQDLEDAHFVWTQNREKDYMRMMPRKGNQKQITTSPLKLLPDVYKSVSVPQGGF